jgi:hypothetical protein
MEQISPAEGLATVAGAAIAISALVEVTKRILDALGKWKPEAGQALAAAYGLILLPLYTTVQYGFEVVPFVLALVVGAQAGVSAGAAYDAGKEAIEAVRDG